MSEPVVFISHFRIREGKADGVTELQRDVTAQLEAEKPRTLGFLAYLSEDGTQISFVHVFADADSMDAHFQGSDDRARAAYEFVEPKGWEIYGRPSAGALEAMRTAATSAGVTLNVQPTFTAGFLRATAAH